MSRRTVQWPLLAVALLCAAPAVFGVLIVVNGHDGGQALGWALAGFFGSGVVVLGRRALAPRANS